ncbi:MAG TPA: peptidoglycan DD-metalloendopeptidase family protein [Hyphomicrobium sp.]|nr:peptidoglycan DD-metalloendopeptidase family protein [Hyphomicrobium sp.]
MAVPLCAPAAAQDAAPASKEDAERSLEHKRQELDAIQSKEKSLQDDVAGLDAERERINAQLLETAALIQRSEGQLTSIEGRLSELEAQERIVRGSLAQRNGQIAKLVAALQRMGRNPPPVLITRREDALKMVRSAMMISSAFPELKDQALSLSGKLDELVRVMTEIRQEGERLRSETARLNEARTRLSGLMEVKKLTLADRRSELASVRAATAEISRSVGDLAELIGRLDKTVSEKTGLGSYNEELRKGAPIRVEPPPADAVATASTSPVPPAPTATPQPQQDATAEVVADASAPAAADPSKETHVAALTPPPRLKPQIIELAPSNAALSGASPGRIKPAIPFAAAQAKLPLPAQGRRVLAFGEKTQYGAHSKGIVIETRAGAQITAPCDGWVVYAGEFRSYGQLLIINAGDGYHILLAGMSQIDAAPGQFVLAAEPVGTMAGAGAGRTGQGAPPPGSDVLYVEFRKDGRPIDPDPWWVAGQQKVQG